MEQQNIAVIPPKKTSVSESAKLILGTDLGFPLHAEGNSSKVAKKSEKERTRH